MDISCCSVTLKVSCGLSGAYTVKLCNSNGGLRSQRPAEVTLNGILAADLVFFEKIGDWTTYTYEETNTVCEAGSQTLRLTFFAARLYWFQRIWNRNYETS